MDDRFAISGSIVRGAPGAVNWKLRTTHRREPRGAARCRDVRSEEATLAEPTDLSLVEAAQAGDVAAFEMLVRRYQTVAFRTAWLITADAADAEEATQEALLKAWRSLDRFDTGDGIFARLRRRNDVGSGQNIFRPWLLAIVANEARNRRRWRGRRPEIAIEPTVESPDEESPEAVAEANERRETLARFLSGLSDDDRLVIELRYFLELTEAEMASVLGIARGTVKSRLSRALARARVAAESGALLTGAGENRDG